MRLVEDVKSPSSDDSVQFAVLLGQASKQLPLVLAGYMRRHKGLTQLLLSDREVLGKVKTVPVIKLLAALRGFRFLLLGLFRLIFLRFFVGLAFLALDELAVYGLSFNRL